MDARVNVRDPLCYACMSPLPAMDAACPRCGERNADTHNLPHQLPCGTVLAGRYLVGRALGQGGFGVTYLGMDLSLGIRVAVKEFFPAGFVVRESGGCTVRPLTGDSGDGGKNSASAMLAKGRAQFLSEARVLAQFDGEPGVVGVKDFFEENGTSYFVMEFLDGQSLKQVLNARGKRPAEEAITLLQPVMRALGRVHEAGLLHRDVSPDNIMLRGDGTPVLIDFGAARTMSARKTHSLSVVVKPGYAAPEQYLRRGEQGPWTDVYALAATLYKLTTGKTPPPSLDLQSGSEKLTPPTDLGADLSPAEESAVLAGMQPDLHKRPQSVAEFRKALRATGMEAALGFDKRTLLYACLAAATTPAPALTAAPSPAPTPTATLTPEPTPTTVPTADSGTPVGTVRGPQATLHTLPDTESPGEPIEDATMVYLWADSTTRFYHVTTLDGQRTGYILKIFVVADATPAPVTFPADAAFYECAPTVQMTYAELVGCTDDTAADPEALLGEGYPPPIPTT